MKKKVALLTCALMVTTVAMGAASCSEKVNELFPRWQEQTAVKTLSALTIDDELGGIDCFGNMIVATETKDSNEQTIAVVYKLFNVKQNTEIPNATVSVPYNVQPPAATDLVRATQSALTKETDGFFFSYEVVESRETITSSSWESETYYTLYGRNGKVATDIQGSYNQNSQVFYADNGARYYVNINGDLVKEENVFAQILTYSDARYAGKTGDYYVEEDGMNYYVYDANGQFVRSVDGAYELCLPNDADNLMKWTVGNYYFVQYTLELPDTAKDYTYISENCKYDVVTQRYDLKKNKVKEIDFEYIVTDYVYCGEENAVLYVQTIADERVSEVELVQAFDKKGKVSVDIQKLVPGANEVDVEGDTMFLYSGGMTYVVQNNEVVSQFVDQGAFRCRSNAFISQTDDNVRIYKLDCTLAKTYDNVEEMKYVNNEMIIVLDTSIVKYNLTTHTESTVCTFAKGKAEVDMGGLAICVNFYGADGIASTSDDTYTYYFLIDGMQDVTLTPAQYNDFSIVSVDSYYAYGETEYTYGIVFGIMQENAQNEAEITYYSYERVGKIVVD